MPRQRNRTEAYLLRLTPEEKENWTSIAQAARITVAELIRKRMARCRIKTIAPINFKAHLLLGEIAKSLSQLSQTLDSTECQSARQLNSIVQTIDEIRLQLLDSHPAD